MPKPLPWYWRFIGVDPGESGGLVALDHEGIFAIDPIPPTERNIWEWFQQHTKLDANNKCRTIALIERISPAIFGIKKSSASKLYGSYMSLRMSLIAKGIPFEEIDAKDWQSILGIERRKKEESTSRWKSRLLAKAQQLYPDFPLWSVPETKEQQLMVCDALLIATVCFRKHR